MFSRPMNHFGGDMWWHPMKPKIHDWVDFKALEFAWEESEGSRLNPTELLEQYLYIEIHEIFFSEFPIVLYEWLLKFMTHKKIFQGGELI